MQVQVLKSYELQGALDGGLDIPHSDKRFAGFKKDTKKLDADAHRNYIFGGHVVSYMRVRLHPLVIDIMFDPNLSDSIITFIMTPH